MKGKGENRDDVLANKYQYRIFFHVKLDVERRLI